MAGTEAAAASGPRTGFATRALGMLAGNVATVGIGFVASILLARVLGPSARGVLAVLQLGATFAVTLACVGLPDASAYYASRRPRLRPALLGNALLVTALMAAVFVPLAVVLREPIGSTFADGYNSWLIVLAAVLVPVTFLDFTSASLLRGTFRFLRINMLTVGGRIVSLAATIVLVWALGWGVAGGLVAGASAQLVMIAGGLAVLVPGGVSFSRRLARACLGYGARVQASDLVSYLNARFDIFVLAVLGTTRNVGYYATAQILAELVLLFPKSFGYVLMPFVAEGRGGADTLSAPAVRLNGALSLLATAALALLGPLVIVYGYGSSFRPALTPFLILLPGVWFLSTGVIVGEALYGRGRPGLASVLTVCEAALTIALDLVLIPLWGVDGAAIASTCAYTAFGIASIVVLSRLDGVRARRLILPTMSELRRYLAGARSLLAAARARRRPASAGSP